MIHTAVRHFAINLHLTDASIRYVDSDSDGDDDDFDNVVVVVAVATKVNAGNAYTER